MTAVRETQLPGVFVIEPDVFRDDRGYFFEAYNRREMERFGITAEFVQDNHSRSRRGVLRGIHYQGSPAPVAKLVRCTAGTVYDVVVDLRVGSETFGKSHTAELSAENKLQIFLPVGFGHAFLVVSDWAEVQYKTSDYYDPTAEGTVRWDDEDLAIEWPLADVTLSQKDQDAPTLRDYLSAPAF